MKVGACFYAKMTNQNIRLQPSAQAMIKHILKDALKKVAHLVVSIRLYFVYNYYALEIHVLICLLFFRLDWDTNESWYERYD